MSPTAIITGITGQDGAYLARLLVQKGYRVIGITRSYTNTKLYKLHYLGIDQHVLIEESDLLDLSAVIKLFERYQPQEVYNLSAQSSVFQSFQQPIETIHYNSISVLNQLEAIRILKAPIRYYQASSSEMYGKVDELPITIQTPMHPLSPYAISKATAFWTVVNYRESYALYACNGVLFNHESYLREENFFVKKVLRQSIRMTQQPTEVLRVGNIAIKRDFGYAPDYVEAMWLMLRQSTPSDHIICSGRSIQLKSIIDHIFQRLHLNPDRIIIDPSLYRPVDIVDIYGDNSLSVEQLNWHYMADFYQVLDQLLEEELLNQA